LSICGQSLFARTRRQCWPTSFFAFRSSETSLTDSIFRFPPLYQPVVLNWLQICVGVTRPNFHERTVASQLRNHCGSRPPGSQFLSRLHRLGAPNSSESHYNVPSDN